MRCEWAEKIPMHALLMFEHYAQCNWCSNEVCMSAQLTTNKINTTCRDQEDSDEDNDSEGEAVEEDAVEENTVDEDDDSENQRE